MYPGRRNALCALFCVAALAQCPPFAPHTPGSILLEINHIAGALTEPTTFIGFGGDGEPLNIGINYAFNTPLGLAIDTARNAMYIAGARLATRADDGGNAGCHPVLDPSPPPPQPPPPPPPQTV